MANEILEGGCHCGSIRYQIHGDPIACGYCHCRDCQQTSGGPAQVWMAVASANFEITAGKPTVYESSEYGRRYFCPGCGSQLLFADARDSSLMFPNAGTLYDPEGIAPAMHIWVDRRLSWFDPSQHLPSYARNAPQDRDS